MKIMLVTAKYYPDGAGAGRSVYNLAKALKEKGDDVVVVSLAHDKDLKQETIDGIKIYRLPLRNIYWPSAAKTSPIKRAIWHIIDTCNFRAAYDFDKILKAETPDIVNTNIIAGFSVLIFGAVKKRGINLVHTLRDYYLLCPQSGMFKNGKPCEKICGSCKAFTVPRKSAARHVDLFLGNSDYILRRHKALGFIQKSQHSAVQFNMNNDDIIAAPRRVIRNKTSRFGFIGRLSDTKGLEVLLQATKHLKVKNWSLKIAGQGDQKYIEKLRAINPDERIEFIGHTPTDEFFETIDTLICPSLYAEPLPRVVYESYKFARPVIAAKMGGTPEIIDEGISGVTYAANDDAALAALMDKISQHKDLYKTLSLGAAKKANLFTKSTIVDQYKTRLDTLNLTVSGKGE